MPEPLLPSLGGGLGDRPDAVVVAGRRASWSELAGAAGAVARRVEGLGAVAVEADASLETVAAIVGCLMAGVPAVPLAPDAGPRELEHVLSDSGAKLVLGCSPGAVAVDMGERADPPPTEPAPELPALIIYTSGTTGPPKGVVTLRRSIADNVDALAEAWDWTGADVLVEGLPLFHIHGLVLGLLGALRVGCRLVHTGRPTPEAYAAAAEAEGGTLFFGVPTVWARVVAQPAAAAALAGARLLVSGSDALPAGVFDQLAAATGRAPLERYGMTETLITISGRADGDRRRGSVGTPLAGVETRVVDDGGEPVPRDYLATGSLWVRAPFLMEGYLNRPEVTAAVLGADGWFDTGDLACWDADGYHRVLGRRATDLIKTGGYRVGAGEVEAALLAHPAVREAAVVGVPDEELGQAIKAFVVADGVSASQLISFVAEELSVHKRPRSVEFVDELPRNAVGKVRKALLRG